MTSMGRGSGGVGGSGSGSGSNDYMASKKVLINLLVGQGGNSAPNLPLPSLGRRSDGWVEGTQ